MARSPCWASRTTPPASLWRASVDEHAVAPTRVLRSAGLRRRSAWARPLAVGERRPRPSAAAAPRC
eukprot:4111705-Pyramimonas_sp.AAC.1